MAQYEEVRAVEVWIWGEFVGGVALNPGTGYYAFEYEPAWLRRNIELAPLHMANRAQPYAFLDLPTETFYRLPPMLADSLPDAFGSAVVTRKLAELGKTPSQITALDRLAYAADRSIGALTFRPPRGITDAKESTLVQLAEVVTQARQMLRGDLSDPSQVHDSLRQLIQVGTSAGGARAKAVIAYNPKTGQMRSGQVDAPDGFEHWIIKLDGVPSGLESFTDEFEGSQGYGRIEYAYYLMAVAAGIQMSECKLLPEGERTHFMTKRFDRVDPNERIHVQSLCAMSILDFRMKETHSYTQYFQTIRELGLDRDVLAQAFRRMVFNVATLNRDDHTKNFAFLLSKNGEWTLAPAFDVTHSYRPSGGYTQRQQMAVNGKFEEITMDDLVAEAEMHFIPGYREIIKEVLEATTLWSEFAAKSGVGIESIAKIAAEMLRFRPA